MAIYGPPEWRRIGGRRMEFSLPIDEFVRCLEQALPPAYAPYVIAGEDRISLAAKNRDARGRRQPVTTGRLYTAELSELCRALDETPPDAGYDRRTIFVGSLRLTPELQQPCTGNVLAWLAATGLPGVEAGPRRPDGTRRVGGFFAVERVVHVATGNIHVHAEYAEIQRAARNAIRRAFRRASSATPPAA